MKVILKELKDCEDKHPNIVDGMGKYLDGKTIHKFNKYRNYEYMFQINNNKTIQYHIDWVKKFIFEEGDDLSIPYIKKAKFDQEMKELINE